MCLSEMTPGQSATIANIPDEDLRVQLLRFGLTAGSRIACHVSLPFGPVVLRFGGQELALGRQLAQQIKVTP